MPGEEFSISQVAEASGLTVETLRAWEKRYGKPKPGRSSSGRRVYNADHLAWLRRAAEALMLGVPPRQVVPLSTGALDRVLRTARLASLGEAAPTVRALLEAVRKLNARRVRTLLKGEIAKRPFPEFVGQVLAPAVARTGLDWESGTLGIQHEHMFTQVVLDVLAQARGWCQIAPSEPARVLITTLPGETHAVGLSILSTVCTLEGLGYLDMGVETPVDSIRATVQETAVRVVGISVSMNTASAESRAALSELRHLLPTEVSVTVGGAGARRVTQRVAGVIPFDDVMEWIQFVKKACSESPG